MNVYITADGGGTKTAIMIKDENKVKTLTFDGSNFYEEERFFNTYCSIFKYLEKNYSSNDNIFLYSANAGFYESRDREGYIVDKLRTLTTLNLEEIKLFGDGEILIETLLGYGEGIVIIMGTGSVIMGVDKNRDLIKVGGNGFHIDDYCSGFTFGRLYLRNVLKGVLPNDFEKEQDILKNIYGESAKQYISSFSKKFFDNIEDESTLSQFNEQIDLLSSDIKSMCKKLGYDLNRVYLHGSVAKNQPLIKRYLSNRFPNINFVVNNNSVEKLMMERFFG
ncbi:MAG: hypothetical protein CR982_03215 [Candidatus Cloacimonadota bacterium]|nr:MAG: hypothetical protein CR982_03215 [Candidatus Cloacimonadota bacterium]PIE77414.1 MAG: hypothetical protein CSA15_13115 [Candidatus Delongbacteria bacterium]